MHLTDSSSRIIRGALQLVIGGAFAALVDQVALDVPGSIAPYVPLIYALIVNVAQNELEARGVVPEVLKPKPAVVADSAEQRRG